VQSLVVMGMSGCRKSRVGAAIGERLRFPLIEGDEFNSDKPGADANGPAYYFDRRLCSNSVEKLDFEGGLQKFRALQAI
jgi:hypothetical protein